LLFRLFVSVAWLVVYWLAVELVELVV